MLLSVILRARSELGASDQRPALLLCYRSSYSGALHGTSSIRRSSTYKMAASSPAFPIPLFSSDILHCLLPTLLFFQPMAHLSHLLNGDFDPSFTFLPPTQLSMQMGNPNPVQQNVSVTPQLSITSSESLFKLSNFTGFANYHEQTAAPVQVRVVYHNGYGY